MVFNEKNQLALLFPANKVYQGREELNSVKERNRLNNDGDEWLKYLLPLRAKFYHITDNAVPLINKVNIELTDDLTFLSKIPDGELVTVFFGPNHFFKFIKDAGILVGLFARSPVNSRLEIAASGLFFDMEKKIINYHPTAANIGAMMFLIRLLAFLYLTNAETKIIEPKEVQGTKRSGKYRNDATQPVTIVNSTWNTWVLRTTGFDVSGHLRLQPCGKNRQDAKLVFIKSFRKHGYVRAPRKEKATTSSSINS